MHAAASMDETDKIEVPSTGEPKRAEVSRAMRFAREHPGLAIAAATGVGLLGGVEVAAGVLFGASIAALVVGNTAARGIRARARDIIDRMRGEVDDRRAQPHS